MFRSNSANPGNRFRWSYGLAVLLVLCSGVAGKYLLKSEKGSNRAVLMQFPSNIGAWQKINEQKFEKKVLETLRVDEYVARDYRKGTNLISVYIGYYHDHKKFAEIHTPENCQANAGWELLSRTERIIRTGAARRSHDVHFAQELFGRNGAKYVFFYFYKIMNDTTTSFFAYKLKVIENSILRRRSDAAFVRVIVPVMDNDQAAAIRTGEEFLQDLAAVIFDVL